MNQALLIIKLSGIEPLALAVGVSALLYPLDHSIN